MKRSTLTGLLAVDAAGSATNALRRVEVTGPNTQPVRLLVAHGVATDGRSQVADEFYQTVFGPRELYDHGQHVHGFSGDLAHWFAEDWIVVRHRRAKAEDQVSFDWDPRGGYRSGVSGLAGEVVGRAAHRRTESRRCPAQPRRIRRDDQRAGVGGGATAGRAKSASGCVFCPLPCRWRLIRLRGTLDRTN